MDLGCLDMGCISVSDKFGDDPVVESSNKVREPNELGSSNSKVGKSKSPRGNNQPTLNALNKCTSQIKKPPHRKGSPLNWFPRKKVDSYLKRKIKMLQEVDGMNLTLDETLGDTNPHYCRVLREKIAAKEAAHKAMEARKAALVEASWCRILKAARIQSKEAEALLLKSEKVAAEAFEAATAMGVIMYDKPNCPQTHCQIETSSVNGGGSTTHTITASFETAFEVDKEVAAAVKTAFVRLANCSSFSKDEFRDLLHKIRETPDTGDSNQELSEFSSECEVDSGSELEIASQRNSFGAEDLVAKQSVLEMRQSKPRRRQSFEKAYRSNLVEVMLERLKCLQEDELSSLATIVATCGLNAALAEVENSKTTHQPSSVSDFPSTAVPNPRRLSSLGAGTMRNANLESFMSGPMRRKQNESELPSLDKCLVRHMSKLEKEVQEAKNLRNNEAKEATEENTGKIEDGKVKVENVTVQTETTSDFGSILLGRSSKFAKEIEEAKNFGTNFETACKKSESRGVSNQEVTLGKKDVPEIPGLDKFLVKHVSKLEKEVLEAKNRRNNDSIEEAKQSTNSYKIVHKNPEAGAIPNEAVAHRKEDVPQPEVPSLDKFLVKHVSRLEKEVQEAKARRNNDAVEGSRETNVKKNIESLSKKENIDLNLKARTEETIDSLDKILVKPVHRLEREKMQALSAINNSWNHRPQKKQEWNSSNTDCEGLDKVLVKHVSRLEREKMKFRASEEALEVEGSGINTHSQSQMNQEGSLDQVLVKHKSRLKREKMAAAAQQPEEVHIKPSVSRRQARERELQEAWGGLSLGNSIRPRLSKLEKDKAAWIKAEEEERRQVMQEL